MYNLNMQKIKAAMQGSIALRVLVGAVGLFLSVALHELFHIVVHWQDIRHIDFFPTPWSMVQIDVAIPEGYDLIGEEMAAYGVTLFVLFVTAFIIFKMNDSEDKRSSGEILFPDDSKMQHLKPSQMLELSELDEDSEPTKPNPGKQ